MSTRRVLIKCIPVTCLGLAYQGKYHCYDEFVIPLYTVTYLYILSKRFNCFDIKRLIFLLLKDGYFYSAGMFLSKSWTQYKLD